MARIIHMLFHCALGPEEVFARVAFKVGDRMIQGIEMLLAGLEAVEPSATGAAHAKGHFELLRRAQNEAMERASYTREAMFNTKHTSRSMYVSSPRVRV